MREQSLSFHSHPRLGAKTSISFLYAPYSNKGAGIEPEFVEVKEEVIGEGRRQAVTLNAAICINPGV